MKNLVSLVILIVFGILKIIAQEPNYNVVFPETYYKAYLSEVKKNEPKNYEDLYLEKVRMPMFQDLFMQSEYASFVFEDLARPSLDIPYLETSLNGIALHKKEIEKIILDALNKCNALIKKDNVTIYIIPPSSELKSMIRTMSGVLGFTAGSKQVIISLDTNIKGWKAMLPYAIAHEYNHVYWTKENFANLTKWTLLDYLVFEGKGDCFAKLLYPKVKTPWTEALLEEKKTTLWERIQPQLENQDFSFQAEIMFGSERFPLWGGYTIGYDIVSQYLSKNESIAPGNWINFTSEKILKSSMY